MLLSDHCPVEERGFSLRNFPHSHLQTNDAQEFSICNLSKFPIAVPCFTIDPFDRTTSYHVVGHIILRRGSEGYI